MANLPVFGSVQKIGFSGNKIKQFADSFCVFGVKKTRVVIQTVFFLELQCDLICFILMC